MLSTRSRIRQILSEGRPRTLQSIGDEVGVSRERVRQLCNILEAEGIRRIIRPIATVACDYCGKVIPAHQRHKNKTNRPYRCMKCRHATGWIMKTCIICGKAFTRKASEIRYRELRPGFTGRYFCSYTCNGRWLGQHYGNGLPKIAG